MKDTLSGDWKKLNFDIIFESLRDRHIVRIKFWQKYNDVHLTFNDNYITLNMIVIGPQYNLFSLQEIGKVSTLGLTIRQVIDKLNIAIPKYRKLTVFI